MNILQNEHVEEDKRSIENELNERLGINPKEEKTLDELIEIVHDSDADSDLVSALAGETGLSQDRAEAIVETLGGSTDE